MRIGLLAYHAACNFGAFLQLLSTVEYVRRRGDEPLVINWVPRDFRKDYERRSLPEVRALYAGLREKYFPMTELCETERQVASVIESEGVEAVIVGSDAVSQHHTLRERVHFPCRRIVYVARPTSDRLYPNCFWGTFNRHLRRPVPVAVMSGSSQDSKYYYIKGALKERMRQSVLAFRYMSVRDDWTREMMAYITDGERVPEVTPDPVFGLNSNAGDLLPGKDETARKFSLPEDYVLLSFKDGKSVGQGWISAFERLARAKGLACVRLPYADAPAFGRVSIDVGEAVTPLEWYSLIKHSRGYVGNNMHPIVSSIANAVPFFSFDNYGIARQGGRDTGGESSKIHHLLCAAGLLGQRVFTKGARYEAPAPGDVLDSLLAFPVDRETAFGRDCLVRYKRMMDDIFHSITRPV